MSPVSGAYPPPNQILSVLAIEARWRDDDTVEAVVGAPSGLLGRDGGPPGMGALLPIVDIVCGSCASRYVEGDWLATADAWLHERAPAVGEIELSARLLRTGRRTIVLACEVTGDGRPAATSTIAFSRIRNDRRSRTTRPDHDGRPTRIGSGPALSRPLDEACGIEVIDPGRGEVAMARSAFVNNSTGTYQGGAIALLADAGAAAVVGPRARVVDLQYRYLARTGDGPAVTSAEILRSHDGAATVRVEVVDRSTDTLVGWALATVLSG